LLGIALLAVPAQAQTFAYVTNSSSSSVSVIDTATNAVTATIEVEGRPIGVAFTPDGSRVYVANSESNSVSVIDTATNTVTATVGVGLNAQSLAITADGTHVYVACFSANSVFVIDTATNTVTATVAVGFAPVGVAITPGIGPPTNKSLCKRGGWKLFTIPRKFKNQGDCVSFVNTGK